MLDVSKLCRKDVAATNDLDAILVKYLEGSTRRLVHSDKMGVNTHAVSDYILASNEGAAIAHASGYHLATKIQFVGEAQLAAHRGVLTALPDVVGSEVAAFSMELTLFPSDESGSSQRVAQKTVDYLRDYGADVTGVFQERGRLDEVFREVTGLQSGN